ncbi:putative membrane protein, partial [Chlamydia psittaci 08-2626_L3]
LPFLVLPGFALP